MLVKHFETASFGQAIDDRMIITYTTMEKRSLGGAGIIYLLKTTTHIIEHYMYKFKFYEKMKHFTFFSSKETGHCMNICVQTKELNFLS